VIVREDARIFVGSQAGVWQYATGLFDLIVNGGFEGSGGWVMPTTQAPATYSDAEAYEGDRSAQLGIVGGANVFSYSSAYQEITIPVDVEQATLTFAQLPLSEASVLAPREARWSASDMQNPAGGDAQYGLLLDPANANTVLRELFWELSSAGAWHTHSYDLTDFAGETVRLHFGVYNDGGGGRAAMYVDAVSLLVRYPGGYSMQLPLFFGPAIAQ
jgi:hypothetical protein